MGASKSEIHKTGSRLASWKLGQEFYIGLGVNSFSRKPQVLLLRLSSDIHVIKGNRLYLKSTNCKCWFHLQNNFTATSILMFSDIFMEEINTLFYFLQYPLCWKKHSLDKRTYK